MFESPKEFIKKNLSSFYVDNYKGADDITRIYKGLLDNFEKIASKLSQKIKNFLSSETGFFVLKELPITLKENKEITEVIDSTTVYSYKFEDLDISEEFLINNIYTLFDCKKLVEDPYLQTIVLNKNIDFVIDFFKQKIYFYTPPFSDARLTSQIISIVESDFSVNRIMKLYLLDSFLLNADLVADIISNFFKKFGTFQTTKNIVSIFNNEYHFSNSNFLEENLHKVLENVTDLKKEDGGWKIYKPHVLIGNTTFDKLTLSKELFVRSSGTPYVSDLVFVNQDRPAVIGPDRYEFEIQGNSVDVTDFWTRVYNYGISNPPTLRSLVESYYGFAPPTMNPMQFLVTHILRNGWMIIEFNKNKLKKINDLKLLGNVLEKIWPKTVGLLVLLNDNNIISTFNLNVNLGLRLYEAL